MAYFLKEKYDAGSDFKKSLTEARAGGEPSEIERLRLNNGEGAGGGSCIW